MLYELLEMFYREYMYTFQFSRYVGVKLLGHKLYTFTFNKYCPRFYNMIYQNNSHQQGVKVAFASFLNITNLCHFNHSGGCWWYHMVVLICISPITNVVEHIFIFYWLFMFPLLWSICLRFFLPSFPLCFCLSLIDYIWILTLC